MLNALILYEKKLQDWVVEYIISEAGDRTSSYNELSSRVLSLVEIIRSGFMLIIYRLKAVCKLETSIIHSIMFVCISTFSLQVWNQLPVF